MALFTNLMKFGYAAANRLLTLQANTQAVSNPGVDEVQIVTGGTVPELKIYNGGQWKSVTRAHLCVRTDIDSTLAATYTYSKTTGAVQKFDNGGVYFTVHDTGGGDFNIKANVNDSHNVIAGTGASLISLAEAGGVKLAATAKAAGNTFTDDYYFTLNSAGVSTKAKNTGGTLRDLFTANPNTLLASSDCFLKSNPYAAVSIAVNETKVITEFAKGTVAMLVVKTAAKAALFVTCMDSTTSIDRIAGNGTVLTTTKDNPNTVNVYIGSNYLEIQNKTAAAVAISIGGLII